MSMRSRGSRVGKPKDITFEISAPATGRFASLIAIAVAGALRDVCRAEVDVKAAAGELMGLCGDVLEACEGGGEGSTHCAISIDGNRCLVRLWSDCRCDFGEIPATLERSKEWEPILAAAESGGEPPALTLTIDLPRSSG